MAKHTHKKPVKTAKPVKKAPAKKKVKALAKDMDKKAKDIVSLRELAPVARDINVRLEKASQADGKAFDHRLAAAIQLEFARDMCEKRKLNFKKWAEVNVSQSYETVKKLVQVGAADDPKLALEDMRLKNKAANRALRDRKASVSRDPSSAPATASPSTPFNMANDAVAALDDKTQLSLIESRAGDLGMSVVSKVDAKKIHDIKKTPIKEVTGIEGVKFYFNNLKPSDKMAFLAWAAAEVGVKLDNPMTNGESKEDLTAIPAHMRRGKRKAVKSANR
ncbi:hypothetical protein LCGC14_0610380 [marine sediment metagenome]|uniref:Uncharacterized protein n=1 Tax=marine sediment metagenome TaxID=412755 RepID=A0A0F9RCJ5_9ZZZZ